MEKIKIIDLLNKMNRGTQPKKIKYNGVIYEYEQDDYIHNFAYMGEGLIDGLKSFDDLLEEVEILEEDKKIEKLELVSNGSTNSYALLNEYGTKCGLTKHSKIMCDKINEIIDYLNKENKFEVFDPLKEQYKWNYNIKIKTKEGTFEYEKEDLSNLDLLLEKYPEYEEIRAEKSKCKKKVLKRTNNG